MLEAIFENLMEALGKDGCLQFVFDRKGVFLIENNGFDEDDFTMEMIDAGAEDVEFSEELITVSSVMEDFGKYSKKLNEMNIEPKEAGLQRIPNNMKETNKSNFDTFMKLIDALEEDDDVQRFITTLSLMRLF